MLHFIYIYPCLECISVLILLLISLWNWLRCKETFYTGSGWNFICFHMYYCLSNTVLLAKCMYSWVNTFVWLAVAIGYIYSSWFNEVDTAVTIIYHGAVAHPVCLSNVECALSSHIWLCRQLPRLWGADLWQQQWEQTEAVQGFLSTQRSLALLCYSYLPDCFSKWNKNQHLRWF